MMSYKDDWPLSWTDKEMRPNYKETGLSLGPDQKLYVGPTL